MNGCCLDDTELVDQVETVSDLGLGVWLMDDLFTLPADSIAGCPGLEETWAITGQAIRDVIESVPQIRGLVFRYGETFESSDSAIKRVGLFDCQCIDCSSMDEMARRRKVIELLESVVCRENGKRCILLWDLTSNGIPPIAFYNQKFSKWVEITILCLCETHDDRLVASPTLNQR